MARFDKKRAYVRVRRSAKNISKEISRLKRDWLNRLEHVPLVDKQPPDGDAEPIYRYLPAPKRMTMDLTSVFENRSSHRTFSDEPLTDEDLGTILWAADGINRPDGGRTTPSTLNWHEVDVYCLKANGTWVYEPAKHALRFLDLEDIRNDTLLAQPLLRIAPVQLVFVAHKERTMDWLMRSGKALLEKMGTEKWTPEKIDALHMKSMTIDAAVKVQAVYMAAAALGIGCVCRTGFDEDVLHAHMPIDDNARIICCMTLGYKAEKLSDAIS